MEYHIALWAFLDVEKSCCKAAAIVSAGGQIPLLGIEWRSLLCSEVYK
jgi:hypothetical protein